MRDDLLPTVLARFAEQKRLADAAINQLDFDSLRRPLCEHTNSICVIMKHMAGNLRSRWTDALTTDGEKPWRNRDDEFIDEFESLEKLRQTWEAGWEVLFAAIRSFTAADLDRTITIRGHRHSLFDALLRALDHAAYHTGQIVLLARHQAGNHWQTLSIDRGASKEFNRRTWGTHSRSE